MAVDQEFIRCVLQYVRAELGDEAAALLKVEFRQQEWRIELRANGSLVERWKLKNGERSPLIQEMAGILIDAIKRYHTSVSFPS